MKKLLLVLMCLFVAGTASATVSVTTSRIDYSCNGSTTVFTYPFKIYEDDDLVAITATSALVESTLILNTDYTVSGAGDTGGGSLTLTAGATCPSGNTLTMLRDIDITQETDYVNGGAITADGLEAPPDKSRIIDQQYGELLDRTLQLPVSGSFTNELPVPGALKHFRWDAAGTAVEFIAIGSSTLAIPADESITGDMIKSSEIFVFPTGLVFKKGADVASAAALPVLADGNSVDVTGTDAITSIDSLGAGTWIILHFDAALVFTHHASNLILPGGGNITTAAGDNALMLEYATGQWRCVLFMPATGLPVPIKDEDDMASNSDVHVATQQSIKAYTDSRHDGSNWPSFRATLLANQTSIITATWTKIEFDTEEFDTNSDYNITNYRFTPTVAGKYMLGFVADYVLTTGKQMWFAIYKNGLIYAISKVKQVDGGSNENNQISTLADANGSTDYFEAFVFHDEGSNETIFNNLGHGFWGSRI